MFNHRQTVFVITLLLAVFTSACSLYQLPDILGLGGLAGSKHFENDHISFDYPGEWRTLAEIWGEGTDVGVADPRTATPWEKYLTSVVVTSQKLPAGSSLETVLEQTDPQAEGDISEGTTIVDGVTAYERVYQKFIGEPLRQIREVWLEKEGTVYLLECRSTPGHFDEAQADFALIIGSFHVK